MKVIAVLTVVLGGCLWWLNHGRRKPVVLREFSYIRLR